MLYDLVEAADGDLDKAEYGILYIDEIDKIKADRNGSTESNMSEAVQDN